jgi:hypothetical protein
MTAFDPIFDLYKTPPNVAILESTLGSCSVNTRLFSRSGVGSFLLELSLSGSFSVVQLPLVMQAR